MRKMSTALTAGPLALAAAVTLAMSPAATGQVVIWDNGPLVNQPGQGCPPSGDDLSLLESTTLGLTVLGFGGDQGLGQALADDFLICSPTDVTSITIYAYQTGGPVGGAIDGMYVQIYAGDGAPGDLNPSVPVFGDQVTNVLSSTPGTTFSGIYRASETTPTSCARAIQELRADFSPPISLAPGRYWLVASASSPLVSGPWFPPVSILGQAETGHARQTTDGGVSWAPITSGTAPADARQAIPFIIEGNAVAVPGPCQGDITGPAGSPDSTVDTLDLLLVLAQWGSAGPEADITGPAGTPDGIVDVLDLLMVIAQWGDCPGGGCPPPSNDMVASAMAVAGFGLQGYDLSFATADGPGGCAVGPNIWYCWTASDTGGAKVSASSGAMLAAYDTCAPGTQIACAAGEISFTATAGMSYMIEMINFPGPAVSGDMIFTSAPPANDECVDKTEIFAGQTAYSTIGATVSANNQDAFCDVGSGDLIVDDTWYFYNATDTGLLNINNCEDLCGSADFDTDIWVYQGCDCATMALIACNDDALGLPCGDGIPLWHSVVEVPVFGGQCYTIRNGGWNTPGVDQGTGVLCLTLQPGPVNDFCGGATPMAPGDPPVTDTTVGAGVDAEAGLCGGILPNSGGVWYTTVGDGTSYTVSTCSLLTDYDSIISVYEGSCAALVCTAANDDACANPFVASTVTWCTWPGRTYYILVHGNGMTGNFELSLTSDGIQCNFPCVVCVGTPEGGVCQDDGFDPDTDPNGGCNSTPTSFGSITFGETICGTGSTYFTDTDGDGIPEHFRDTDWYAFTVTAPATPFTATLESDFEGVVFIISDPTGDVTACTGASVIFSASTAGACDIATITNTLDPGTYALFAATAFPPDDHPFPCSGGLNNYRLTLTSP